MPTFFAIRRKDGVFMPDIKGRAGGTFIDPDNKFSHRGTPRLFIRPQDAKAALEWWAAGKFLVLFDEYGHDMSGKKKLVEGRNIEDWSIVEVELKEVLDI